MVAWWNKCKFRGSTANFKKIKPHVARSSKDKYDTYSCKGKVKVKSLSLVHIQAQSSTLQTLTSTFPGHWAFTLHIHLEIHLNSLGSIQPLTRNLAPRLTNLPSWVERSNATWSALLRGTTSRRTGRVLNSGLDLDPNPESCTLPLDQLAAAIHVSLILLPWPSSIFYRKSTMRLL